MGRGRRIWESEGRLAQRVAEAAQRDPLPFTFGRVFALIDPKQFEASFHQWVQGISPTIQGVIAIDGKTSRRTHDQAAGKKALHLVSAWAVENRLVLAQLARRARNRTRSPPFRCSAAVSTGGLHRHH